MNEKRLNLAGHLTELRACLLWTLAALAGGMGISLFFAKRIFTFLQKPMLEVLPPGSRFIATNPLEAWVTYLKVALLAGAFISSPVVLYQIWRFVAPGLYRNEKKSAILFALLTSICFVGGGLFGYFVIFPIGFRFFVSVLAGTEILFLPQMKDYLGFIARMLLTFGILFELPVILPLLAHLGVLHRDQLVRARRTVVVLAFLAAGLLTPGPDVLSQLLLALPLLVLYEISLLTVRFVGRS